MNLLKQNLCRSYFAFLLMLVSAAPLTAGHVRTYCFFADDSTTVYEDSFVKIYFAFGKITKQLELLIKNKSEQTVYLNNQECVVNTNNSQTSMNNLEYRRTPVSPGATTRLHGWMSLFLHLDKNVITQGSFGRMFDWKPGHKGKFINPEDGSTMRFNKGDTRSYEFSQSPLAISARVSYSLGKNDSTVHHARVRYYVSDVYVGAYSKETHLGSDAPNSLRNRSWFSFDSGGCSPFVYSAGVTIKGAVVAVGITAVAIGYGIIENLTKEKESNKPKN